MSKIELKEMIKVMQHYENGGKVEYTIKKEPEVHWATVTSPSWDWVDCDYRIKEQKQKVTIEKWLIKDVYSGEHFIMESSAVNLTLQSFPNGCKVKLIESYEVEL